MLRLVIENIILIIMNRKKLGYMVISENFAKTRTDFYFIPTLDFALDHNILKKNSYKCQIKIFSEIDSQLLYILYLKQLYNKQVDTSTYFILLFRFGIDVKL